jgi:hypothetical protein
MYPTRYKKHKTSHFRLQSKSKRLRQFTLHAVFCWSFVMPALTLGQNSSHPYENPRFQQLYATLRQPSSMIAKHLTLREALNGLEESLQQTVWLDRRIDGEQIINLESGQRTHQQCLSLINSLSNTETAWLENIIYITPSHYASRIETNYWNLYTGNENIVWRKPTNALTWKSSLEAREIHNLAIKEQNIPIRGIDALPHDRWPHGQVTACSRAARWTCLLAGFDKTIKRDTKTSWKIDDSKEPANVGFEYADLTKRYPNGELQVWRGKWPKSVVTPRKAGRFYIEAPVAAHRELVTMSWDSKLKQQAPPRMPKSEEEKYSLTLSEWTIGVGLPTLAKQLGLEITPWPLPDEIMNRQVELKLKDVTVDEMLKKIGEQAKIGLQRKDNQIQVLMENM